MKRSLKRCGPSFSTQYVFTNQRKLAAGIQQSQTNFPLTEIRNRNDAQQNIRLSDLVSTMTVERGRFQNCCSDRRSSRRWFLRTLVLHHATSHDALRCNLLRHNFIAPAFPSMMTRLKAPKTHSRTSDNVSLLVHRHTIKLGTCGQAEITPTCWTRRIRIYLWRVKNTFRFLLFSVALVVSFDLKETATGKGF